LKRRRFQLMLMPSAFPAADENLSVLREGCFKYFQLGGTALSGPVSLLSALAPKPLLLAYHFFFVAFYSIWCMFVHPKPVYARESTRPYPSL
jgi:squalene monooxygenase